MTIPLYDLPRGAKIKCEANDGSKYVIFDHVDGIFSYCTTEKGGIAHISIGAKFILEDGVYVFVTN